MAAVTITAQTTVIDLSIVSFVKPGGVATLASLIDACARMGYSFQIVAPLDCGAYNYLARVHFSHFLEEVGCTHNFPTVRENALGHDLVPLTRVATRHDANSLGEAALAFASPFNEDAAQALCCAIGEAGENVSFHSGVPSGFAAAQRFSANSYFEFAVADSGHGLLTNLGAVGATDHASAIDLALTEGVSSTGGETRGYGLSSIESSVASVLGGTLSLLSGDTITRSQRGIRRSSTLGSTYQGTVVFARFRGPTRRT